MSALYILYVRPSKSFRDRASLLRKLDADALIKPRVLGSCERVRSMLDLKDFFHLPEVDTLVSQLADDAPGLIVVAGLDPATPADASGFLPSGRAAIFRILMRHIMLARPARHVIVVATSKDAVRIPRHSQRQVESCRV